MEGILNVLKPCGMSSSDAVVDVRRLTGVKRVGHLGTLDPQAGGVLPVCVGRAVRLFDYLVDKRKEYICELAIGIATDTQDAQGEILSRNDRIVCAEEVRAVLPSFLGEQEQLAPMYSALKYNGKKLYDLARAGKEIPEKRRTIRIDRLDFLEQVDTNRFLLRVGCSRGTYIRTLCADIGAALSMPAHMAFLLRTASGAFSIEHSYTVSELETKKADGTLSDAFVSCEEAVAFLPRLDLKEHRDTATRNGLPTRVNSEIEGTVRMYCKGIFLGIGTVHSGEAKLIVHLY